MGQSEKRPDLIQDHQGDLIVDGSDNSNREENVRPRQKALHRGLYEGAAKQLK